MIGMRFSQSEFILHDLWQIKDFLTIFIHSIKKREIIHSISFSTSTGLHSQRQDSIHMYKTHMGIMVMLCFAGPVVPWVRKRWI